MTQWVKNLPSLNAGDTGGLSLIPGLRRSPGEGNGNPLQYFRLDNPMDKGAWWATVHGSRTVGHDWLMCSYLHGISLSFNISKYNGSSFNLAFKVRISVMTESVDMSLSNLWKIMKDREAWRAVVHGLAKSWIQLSNRKRTTISIVLGRWTHKLRDHTVTRMIRDPEHNTPNAALLYSHVCYLVSFVHVVLCLFLFCFISIFSFQWDIMAEQNWNVCSIYHASFKIPAFCNENNTRLL